MRQGLNRHDLLYIADTLMPETDREQAADRLQAGDSRLDEMLDDLRLFRRLMGEENILLRVSPWLFFTVLLRRAWRDLDRETFTVEQRNRQKIVLFDADRVVYLLAQGPVRDYLATMLTSFTRVESVTVLVETSRGNWRGYRTNELDVEGMVRYSQTLDERLRFAPYKRIGDVCLFLTGMFPEYINGRYRYPASGRVRPHMRSRLCQQMEDYEAYGQSFYQQAADHELARQEGLAEVLLELAENFILAEKSVAFLASRYLQFARHTLFEM
jgi:hypothetical protein